LTELVVAEAQRWDGLEVEHLTLGGVLTRFRDHPGTVDLNRRPRPPRGAMSTLPPTSAGSLHTVASAWLSETGPVSSAARVCDGPRDRRPRARMHRHAPRRFSCCSGKGSAHAPPRARSSAQVAAAAEGLRPSVTTTREFADDVIENLSAARTDTEHFEEFGDDGKCSAQTQSLRSLEAEGVR